MHGSHYLPKLPLELIPPPPPPPHHLSQPHSYRTPACSRLEYATIVHIIPFLPAAVQPSAWEVIFTISITPHNRLRAPTPESRIRACKKSRYRSSLLLSFPSILLELPLLSTKLPPTLPLDYQDNTNWEERPYVDRYLRYSLKAAMGSDIVVQRHKKNPPRKILR